MATARRFVSGHQHNCRRTVINARRIACRNRPFFHERGPQARERVNRDAMANKLIIRYNRVAFPALDSDRYNFIFKTPRCLRRLSLVLGRNSKMILRLATDLPAFRNILSCLSHMITVESIPQSVFEHCIHKFQRAHLGARPHVGSVGGSAHAFLPAGHHNVRIAVQNCLITKRDSTQARPTQLIDTPGWHLHRKPGRHCSLPGRVLTFTRLQDLPHNRLGNGSRINPCPRQCTCNCNLPQLMSRERGQSPVERPDRRPRGTGNHNLCCFHCHRSTLSQSPVRHLMLQCTMTDFENPRNKDWHQSP